MQSPSVPSSQQPETMVTPKSRTPKMASPKFLSTTLETIAQNSVSISLSTSCENDKDTSSASRAGKSKNPFESSPLMNSFAENIVTPGIFQRRRARRATAATGKRGTKVRKRSQEEAASTSFWSIEHMAAILPVEFPEVETGHGQPQTPDTPGNPEFETRAHAAIESFWSRNAIYAPSPETSAKGRALTRSGRKLRTKEKKNGGARDGKEKSGDNTKGDSTPECRVLDRRS